MQDAIKVLSVKASSPASLFTVEVHDEHVTDLDNSSRSDAQSLLACAAHYVSFSSQEKLVALLRITQKFFMNIDCRRLKSRAAMTEWWGLL